MPPMIGIRAMAQADGAEVLRINAASQPKVALLDEKEWARLMALPGHHLVATREGAGVVGYMLVFFRETPYDGEEFLALRSAIAEPFIYADQVAVAEEFQGRGIGRAFYEELESAAGRRGVRILCCDVNLDPPNPGSSAFHRKLGFGVAGLMVTRDGRDVELLAKERARWAFA